MIDFDDTMEIAGKVIIIFGLLVVFGMIGCIPFLLFKTVTSEDKWKDRCGDHVIVASYAKNETESDPQIITGVSTNGNLTTGTIFVDKNVTNYYIVLDDNSMWKVPRNVGPYIKEGDLSNKYCNVDINYIK